jgi:hypothetical protein
MTRFAYGAPQKRPATDVTISATPYTPIADYPIQSKAYSDVTLKDNFWKSKVDTNARVTIPFAMQKVAQSESARAFGTGILEASIVSLKTHPDAPLQATVDGRIHLTKPVWVA